MASPADDERFMAEAIRLSYTHLGQTGTNPSVGCVIVRDGEIVGRGVTALGGRPHAEPQALAEAGARARGATAYVTLEPCSHHGRTPPCANAMVAAGVARVVVGVADPDERVSGQGLRILNESGIDTELGLMETAARRALAGYLTRQTKKRPQVILKLAVSADGMLGARDQGQVSITGPEARQAVHRLRAQCDAILIGIGTAVADDPELTVRLAGLQHLSPIRIVLDRRLELPLTGKLVASANEVPLIVVTMPEGASTPRRAALEGAGVEVLEAADLGDLLHQLACRGISTLMVEGGARTARDFLEADLVDRIDLYTGPVEIGADGIESPITTADIPRGFQEVGAHRYGPDQMKSYERAL